MISRKQSKWFQNIGANIPLILVHYSSVSMRELADGGGLRGRRGRRPGYGLGKGRGGKSAEV